MRFTPQVLPSRKGNLGIFELNHPKILHALTLDMIHCMTDVWSDYTGAGSHIRAILVKSSPDTKAPAFCAGGDVKSVYMSGMESQGTTAPAGATIAEATTAAAGYGASGHATADFFREEYVLNHKMATSPIPQISFWNGIVMGGGAGISIHGKYRVATEHSKFAMPETNIGLFCDVGSMWWMPRMLHGGLAKYVALTGARLKPEDLIYTGLATHYVPAEKLSDLEVALVKATEVLQETPSTEDVVLPVLTSFNQAPTVDPLDSFLAKHRTMIDDSFQEDCVETIVDNLHVMNNEFSDQTLATLKKMSPTSLKVTLEGLNRGAACQSIGEALQMEYRMSQACMRPGSDFYEGIRAVLVDKDHNPKWNPEILADVTKEMVESYFEPLGENEWVIPTVVVSSKL